eukprot:COSAG06_NODE_19982_length_814_cov_1.965035_3_plen_36_part_01
MVRWRDNHRGLLNLLEPERVEQLDRTDPKLAGGGAP